MIAMVLIMSLPGAAGAEVFVAARLVYWPVYLAGIRLVRTATWMVSVVGLALLASAAL